MPSIKTEDSWAQAEQYCFDELVKFTESKANSNAFLGWLPDPPQRDAWMFTSGGLHTGPIEMFSGGTALWCTFSMDASIDIVTRQRSDAQTTAMKMVNALKENDNFRSQHNIQELRLASLPSTPTVLPMTNEDGQVVGIMWNITIPLEMLYAVQSELS